MFFRFDERKGKNTTTHVKNTTLHYYPRKNIMLWIAFIHVSTTFFFRSSSLTSVVVEAYPFGSINSMVSYKHQVHSSTSTSTCPHFPAPLRDKIYSKNSICHHSRRSVSSVGKDFGNFKIAHTDFVNCGARHQQGPKTMDVTLNHIEYVF